MSRWLLRLGCGLVGIGLVLTLTDFLPVDLWGLLTDPAERLRPGPHRIVPVEAGEYVPTDMFIAIGVVALIAWFAAKRHGR